MSNENQTVELINKLDEINQEMRKLQDVKRKAKEDLAWHIIKNEPQIAEAIIAGASVHAIQAAYHRVNR